MARGDREAMAAAFADDVVARARHQPVQRHVPRQGRRSRSPREALRSRLQTRFDVHDVVANVEHAVALVHLHLEDAGGRRYDQQQVQVMHLREGLIAEYWAMNQDQAVLDLLMGD